MGGVLVDEEGFVTLLDNDVAVVQLTHHPPVLRFRHGEGRLFHFRLFQIL